MNKSQKLKIGLLVIFILAVFGLYTALTPLAKPKNVSTISSKSKLFPSSFASIDQDFPQLNFTDVTNTIIEVILDIFWDVDGDSSFEGIFPLIFSYIPFLGDNGTVFTDSLFILSVSFGVIMLAKKIKNR